MSWARAKMTRSPERGVAFSMRRSMSGYIAHAPQGPRTSTGQRCAVARMGIVVEGPLLKPFDGRRQGRHVPMEAVPTLTIADGRGITAAVPFNRNCEVRIVTHANDFLVFTHRHLREPGTAQRDGN